MNERMEQTIAALGQMSIGQLRDKYLEIFGEPTRSGNRQFLFKRLAWRVQSLAEGGLSERARRRAEELARDADIRTTLPRPPKQGEDGAGRSITMSVPRSSTHDRLPIPGTILTRKYRGQQVEVKVLPKGFEYQGQIYCSLSALAKAITGTHWNGLLFFGLTQTKGNPA